jgi:D-alanyl-D-alanine carboxypeptidase
MNSTIAGRTILLEQRKTKSKFLLVISCHFRLHAVLFVVACCLNFTCLGADPNSPRDISGILQTAVKSNRVPGLAAIVLQGDRIVAEGVAGVRKSGEAERITLNDQFLLCSATKAMTATLVAIAVEEGRLAYTTTLGEIFPGKALHEGWKKVTVMQLLEHRAGVPKESSRLWTLLRLHFSRSTTAEKRDELLGKILHRSPKYPPGSKYLYTALDYVILGEILEKVSGRSWEDLIQERLWRPLGITSGGFGAPGSKGKIDQPWGHWGMVFNGCSVSPGGFWSRLSMPLFMGPGGGAHMTITDWAKFIDLHLRGDPANPNQHVELLQPDSFTTLHRADSGKEYQAGWFLGTRPWAKGSRADDTGRVLASQGDNGFWHTEAWLAPEKDLALLIICNRGGVGNKPAAKACNDVLAQLIREFR